MIDLTELLVRVGPKAKKIQGEPGVSNLGDDLLQARKIKLQRLGQRGLASDA